MKKCRACKNDIEDDANYCKFCGASQDSRKQTGAIIRDCKHCDGTGECRNAKTLNKEHSCAYCIEKSGIKNTLFPIVPCAYCGGKGFHVIQIKQEKSKKEQKKGENNA